MEQLIESSPKTSQQEAMQELNRGLWRLCVREECSLAHALRHYQGKCENLHGHNFAIEMTVEGKTLIAQTEILIDFKDLRKILRDILEELDHKLLNEIPPFDVINPSSENLARYLWQRLKQGLAKLDPDLRLFLVSVSENARQTASYQEI